MNLIIMNGAMLVLTATFAVSPVLAQQYKTDIPPAITAPESVETRLGTQRFKDGSPGWNTILRLYGPLQPWFDKTWRPGEIEEVRDSSSPSLSGKRWKLKEVNGVAVKSTRAYLEFDLKAKRFSGDAGCNRVAGGFSLDGTRLRFSQVISTKRACADQEIQKVENDFLKALAEVKAFQIESRMLRMTNGDRTILTFKSD